MSSKRGRVIRAERTESGVWFYIEERPATFIGRLLALLRGPRRYRSFIPYDTPDAEGYIFTKETWFTDHDGKEL